MAFITSGTSVNLDLQLTNYGRGVVLTGDLQSRIAKFSLSDIDIDYRQPISTGHTTVAQGGLIPDISGNHVNCSNGINDGFKCSSYIHQTAEVTDPGDGDAQVVVGIDKDMNGVITHYSDVSVDVYMHDYYALCKLLSLIYSEDNGLLFKGIGSDGDSTVSEQQQAFLSSFSATSAIVNGSFNSSTITLALELIEGKRRGQFLDFWDEVKVNYPNFGKVDESIYVTSSDQTYMNNAAALSGRLGLKTVNCNFQSYDTLQRYRDNGLLEEVQGNNSAMSVSPFTLSFASKGDFKGAGSAGIGFTTTEFGYLTLGTDSEWGTATDSYPQWDGGFSQYTNNINYDTKKYYLGFVHPVEFENMLDKDYSVPLKTGQSQPVAGYNTNQTAKTYQQVRNVLPALKFGWSVPLNTPNIGGGGTGTDPIDDNLQSMGKFDNILSKKINYSNFYYPIKPSRAQKVQKSLSYKDFSWAASLQVKNYHQSTYSNLALDTFALLGTNLEYTNVLKNNQGAQGMTMPSVSTMFGTTSQEVYEGGHYYNWFGRMMISGDEFFQAIQTNYSNGNVSFPTITNSYSAKTVGSADEIDEFNIRIPVAFSIYSSDNPNATPATCTVNFVYNKLAAKQSIGYSGYSNFESNQPNHPYWRVYDRALVGSEYSDRKPRFYGEDGEAPSEYTTDPTQVSNDGTLTGKRIFRKVLAGGTTVI